jgi:nucleotide-binding universal stress UspA family protein
MFTVLVQAADESWTTQAMHLAAALARNEGGEVALLRLLPVQHLEYLGTPLGDESPTSQEYDDLKQYAATAEDYGVELTVYTMQCFAPLDAVAQAAELVDAQVVFASVPPSHIPYRQRLRTWWLAHRLNHRQLFTLDQPAERHNWVPSITVSDAALDKHAHP